ncbi:hypothetical protein MMC07_007070 [Pseudocyphellaria aurata]|nr:hypothetical protein [Pseudocyphellaria aurata]
MSSSHKYVNLPDLDPAPDVYETPDLIDDSSTQQHPETSTALRSESPASSYHDLDEDDGGTIDRQPLNPDEARTHFLPAQRNRTDPGLSDRINGKRRQYRESSRARRGDSLELQEGPGLSDEDEESLERKVARLRQEVAEVKGEFNRRRAEGARGEKVPQDVEDTLDALGRVLDGADAIGASGAASRMVKKLGVASRANDTSKDIPTAESQEQNGRGTAYTVTYGPSYQHNHALAKVAEFDARISFIETVLGIDSIPLPTQERPPTRAIFPVLDNLDRQISTLSNSTESSLDSINRRVQQLTQDAQKLGEARAAARAAQEALSPDEDEPVRPFPATDGDLHDPEHVSKINALYGTLATIESLAPLLPSVLDRLRSLQSIHADAARASQNLADLETRQENMAQELQSWRDGLEKVEGAMQDGERTMAGNVTVVEQWVQELEGRIKTLGFE